MKRLGYALASEDLKMQVFSAKFPWLLCVLNIKLPFTKARAVSARAKQAEGEPKTILINTCWWNLYRSFMIKINLQFGNNVNQLGEILNVLFSRTWIGSPTPGSAVPRAVWPNRPLDKDAKVTVAAPLTAGNSE